VIIKSVRVGAGASQRRFRDHLFRGAENDAVAILRGTEADITDLFADARRGGARYAVRHWIIAPHEAMTRDQARHVVEMLAKEFGFNASAAVMIEHQKRRATGDAFGRHWHVAVGEFDPATGRVLSSSHDHPRHELVARRAEIAFGHQIVPGPHSRAVVERLRSEGLEADAARIREAMDAAQPERPREAFTTTDHQAARREGIDLPAIRVAVRGAWTSTQTRAELIEALGALGLTTSTGEKAGEWVVRTGDQFLGSLRRLARVPKSEFLERMERPNDRPEQQPTVDSRPSDSPTSRRPSEALRDLGASRLDFDYPDHARRRGVSSERSDGARHDHKGNREAGAVLGGPSRSDDRTGGGQGASKSGAGALAPALDAFRERLAQTLSDLAGLAQESSDSVNQKLAEDEAAARRAVIDANRSRPVSTAALEAARRTAEAAASEHTTFVRRIQELDSRIADAQRQPPLSWIDRLRGEQRPKVDFDDLRRERDALAARQRVGEQRMLNARASVERLERQHFAELSSEAQRQRQAVFEAKAKLADVQQTRHLVVLLPRLAYCRPPYIRSLGARVRRRRRGFGDPNAVNVWGLPIDGPGTGNR
jgi:hypothetical protein